jgi:inner membrane protein
LVAKTGLERVSPYATAASIVAANAPDLDLISVVGGRWSYLQHHRGTSHSIVGVLGISLGIAGLFWLAERMLARRAGREPRIRLGGLALICLAAGATHPILDWTNNYGVRPLLPFSGQWYYGDLVFVFDPWIWLVLGGAAFLITARTRIRLAVWLTIATVLSLAMIIAFVVKVAGFPPIQLVTVGVWFAGLAAIAVVNLRGTLRAIPRQVALAALLLVPVYWGFMAYMRERTRNVVEPASVELVESRHEQLKRLALMPTFGDPRRWQTIAESTGASYRAVASTAGFASEPQRFPFPDRQQKLLVEEAKKAPDAEVFLGFARFPVVRVDGACPNETFIRFADLRYTEPGAERAGFAVEVPVRCDQVAPLPAR